MMYMVISQMLQNPFLVLSSLVEDSWSLDVSLAVTPAFPRPLFQAPISERLDLLGSGRRGVFLKQRLLLGGDAHLGCFTFPHVYISGPPHFISWPGSEDPHGELSACLVAALSRKGSLCFPVGFLAPLLYGFVTASQPGSRIQSSATRFPVFFHWASRAA